VITHIKQQLYRAH